MNGTVMNAHRASYIIHFGTFNKSLFVCHTCDIRHCVNPGHLFLGTNADNMADMIKKGRKFTKVTHQDIEDIKDWKRAGYKQLHIAKAYGISTALTSLIINNHRWQLPTY
jgi:hypothetical protein